MRDDAEQQEEMLQALPPTSPQPRGVIRVVSEGALKESGNAWPAVEGRCAAAWVMVSACHQLVS